MATWTPDPTFYPSPRMAMKAPPEKHAYVAAFDPARRKPDTIAVVDVDPGSSTYSRVVCSGWMTMRIFGIRVCTSARRTRSSVN